MKLYEILRAIALLPYLKEKKKLFFGLDRFVIIIIFSAEFKTGIKE